MPTVNWFSGIFIINDHVSNNESGIEQQLCWIHLVLMKQASINKQTKSNPHWILFPFCKTRCNRNECGITSRLWRQLKLVSAISSCHLMVTVWGDSDITHRKVPIRSRPRPSLTRTQNVNIGMIRQLIALTGEHWYRATFADGSSVCLDDPELNHPRKFYILHT